jgi:hypothetical protein
MYHLPLFEMGLLTVKTTGYRRVRDGPIPYGDESTCRLSFSRKHIAREGKGLTGCFSDSYEHM